MSVKAGRRRTVVGIDSEEFSSSITAGKGMSEAESISFWSIILSLTGLGAQQHIDRKTFSRPRLTYPVRRILAVLAYCLHHAAFFILDVPHPVRFAGGDQEMSGPAMHMTIQPIVLLNLPFGGVFDRAALAIVVTIFAIDIRMHLGK